MDTFTWITLMAGAVTGIISAAFNFYYAYEMRDHKTLVRIYSGTLVLYISITYFFAATGILSLESYAFYLRPIVFLAVIIPGLDAYVDYKTLSVHEKMLDKMNNKDIKDQVWKLISPKSLDRS